MNCEISYYSVCINYNFKIDASLTHENLGSIFNLSLGFTTLTFYIFPKNELVSVENYSMVDISLD